jgi:hypothetical protein
VSNNSGFLKVGNVLASRMASSAFLDATDDAPLVRTLRLLILGGCTILSLHSLDLCGQRSFLVRSFCVDPVQT